MYLTKRIYKNNPMKNLEAKEKVPLFKIIISFSECN